MTEDDLDRVHADLLLEEKRAVAAHDQATKNRNRLVEQVRALFASPDGLTVDDDGLVSNTYQTKYSPMKMADLVDTIRNAADTSTRLAEIRAKLSRFS